MFSHTRAVGLPGNLVPLSLKLAQYLCTTVKPSPLIPLPNELLGTRSLDIQLDDGHVQPSKDGHLMLGSGDRGSGLAYKVGRLTYSLEGMDKSRVHMEAMGQTDVEASVCRVIKVQAPVDSSDDARGGIGRMTPATLLIHDRAFLLLRLCAEGVPGHSTLLQATLRQQHQTGFFYAQVIDRQGGMRIFLDPETLPTRDGIDW